MVLIFLLSIFSVAQFTLSDVLTNKDTAIDRLNKQLGDLASQLSLEKSPAETCRRTSTSSPCSSRQRAASATSWTPTWRPKRRADDLKIERDALTERLTSMLAESDRTAFRPPRSLQDAARGNRAPEGRAGRRHQKEIERQRLELTRLAAALAAANNEKGKLFTDLTEEQKLTAEQKAANIRMTAEPQH